jgi:hypothetical protein
MRALRVLAMALVLPCMARAQTAGEGDSPMAPMPSRVVLTAPTCAAALPAEVLLRMLRVELVGDRVERVDLSTPGGDAEGALARVSIEAPRCEADASEFVITLDDAATRKSVRRAVDLGDIPVSTRARALALAVAELLRASWLELALPNAPAPVAPVPETVRDTVRLRIAATAPRARPVRETPRYTPIVLLQGESRTFALTSSSVAGVRVVGGVTTPWGGDTLRVRLRGDLGVAFGTGVSTLGDVDATLGTGALALTFGRASTLWGFEVGPRIEAGVVRAVGRIPPGSTATGITVGEALDPVVTLSALIALRGRLAGALAASLEADIGYTLGGVDARAIDTITGIDARVFGITGASFSLRVAIGWDP